MKLTKGRIIFYYSLGALLIIAGIISLYAHDYFAGTISLVVGIPLLILGVREYRHLKKD